MHTHYRDSDATKAIDTLIPLLDSPSGMSPSLAHNLRATIESLQQRIHEGSLDEEQRVVIAYGIWRAISDGYSATESRLYKTVMTLSDVLSLPSGPVP